MPIEAKCLCESVTVTLNRRPEDLHECNCRLCRSTGARWAYSTPADAEVRGETHSFLRSDKADAGAHIHFCPRCGTTTHFRLTEAMVARHGDTIMGINMRLANPEDVAGVELRFPNGRDWDGKGPFDYVRDSVVLGAPD